jgi:AsmA family protein
VNAFDALRRGLKWLLGGLVGLIAIALLLAAALDAGYFQGPLVKFLASRAQRQIRVDGPLRLRLLARNPRLVAEHVTVGNPPWTPSGTAVQVDKVTVVFETPRLGRDLEIARLEIEGATLHMFRDSSGHANWQIKNPDKSVPQGLPITHALLMRDAHVLLEDAQRHRRFDGNVSAQDANAAQAAQPLRIDGSGQLNGRPVSFEVIGDPLRTARSDTRYAFTFTERSSGSHLTGKGVLLQPFDLHYFDASFEASGADLKDLYYLTGTNLPDTGSYHLSGKVARRGYTSSFRDLAVTFGLSDVHGSVSIDQQKEQSNIAADLNSQSLHLSDLGPRAAGRDPESESERPLLLSTAAPDPSALRHMDAAVKFRARRVDAGRVTLSAVAASITIDRGLLTVTALSADVLDGKLNAQLKIDARKEIPAVDLDVRITGLQLGQYARKAAGPPAIEGPLGLRVILTGRGKSLHQVAASADGSIKATLRGGAVRDSLAELSGVDLRGLGLLLAKNKKEIPIHCGIASFRAHDGVLTGQNLVLDTEPVLIAAEGVAHLDTESLDFVLRGYPKSVRLFQLRAPILIRGTLAHPSVGIQAHDSKLVLIDRGNAKDADCESLLQ